MPNVTGFVAEARSQTTGRESSRVQAELPAISEVVNGRTELVTYRGIRAVKLIPLPGTVGTDQDGASLDFGEILDGVNVLFRQLFHDLGIVDERPKRLDWAINLFC